MDFGIADLNNNQVPVPWRSLESTYPIIPPMTMNRAGTAGDFSTVILRAFRYYQEFILKKDPRTWVPIIAGTPQQKIYPASQPTETKIGIQRSLGNISRLDDYYFLHPFADMVTYTLKYQAPKGYKKPFGAEKIRRPDKIETFPVSGVPGLYYEVYSQPMDALYQFDCWASNSRAADNLADFFRYFMEFMKGSIMLQGFGHIQFWERGIDKETFAWREDIAWRSLQYYVELQDFYFVPTNQIKSVGFQLQLQEGYSSEDEYFVRHVIQDQSYPPSGVYPYPSGIVTMSGYTPSTGTNLLIEKNT